MINILIVDDDIATVEAIRDTINWYSLGIDQVVTSYNVSGAKKILSEQQIDIVVSDIEMPQETGLDLLKWVREQNMECEFLLLTCHENFTFAAHAISFAAAAYLTKPYDINIMEFNLQKIVAKLRQKRSMKKNSEYGVWMETNLRFLKLDFWKSILEDELHDTELIEQEIEKRHLDINANRKYCIVYTKISNTESDMERYGKSIFEFIMEDFHAEILTEKVGNECVIKNNNMNALSYITICDEESPEKLRERCDKLSDTCNRYFKSIITCCISYPYYISEIAQANQKLKQLFDYNLGYYGKSFFEWDVEIPATSEIHILDLEKIIDLVARKDKTQILKYLKLVFDELSVLNKLNLHSLYLIKQELVQVVYADLMKEGIQATKLFYDNLSIRTADQASASIIDMIRWVNYLLEKTFLYEEEVTKSHTIIDKINVYIQEHYAEDIGRNEIAGIFFLTPEYLAKLYKKRTGIYLKDYINEYRIEKAKEFLKLGDKNISDVAELVGFDNFSYFSTLFKKITGVSPKEFKGN